MGLQSGHRQPSEPRILARVGFLLVQWIGSLGKQNVSEPVERMRWGLPELFLLRVAMCMAVVLDAGKWGAGVAGMCQACVTNVHHELEALMGSSPFLAQCGHRHLG